MILPFLALISGVMSAPGPWTDLMNGNNNFNNFQSFTPPVTTRATTTTTTASTTTTTASTTITTRKSTATTVSPRVTTRIPPPDWGQKILIPNKPGSEKFTNVLPTPEDETSESKPLEFEEIIDDNHYDDLLSYLGLDMMDVMKLKNMKRMKENVRNVDEILDDESQRHLVEDLGVNPDALKEMSKISKLDFDQVIEDEETLKSLASMGVDVLSVKDASKIRNIKKKPIDEGLLNLLQDQEFMSRLQSLGYDVSRILKAHELNVLKADNVLNVLVNPEKSKMLENIGIDSNQLKIGQQLSSLKNVPLDNVVANKDKFGWLFREIGVDLSMVEQAKDQQTSLNSVRQAKVADVLAQPETLQKLQELGIDKNTVVEGAKLGFLKKANLDEVLTNPEALTVLNEVGIDRSTLDTTSKLIGVKNSNLNDLVSNKAQFAWLGELGVDLKNVENLQHQKDSVSALHGFKVSDLLSQPDKLNILQGLGIDTQTVVQGAKFGFLKGAKLDQILSNPEALSLLKEVGVDISTLDKTSKLGFLKVAKVSDILSQPDKLNILQGVGIDTKTIVEGAKFGLLKGSKLDQVLSNPEALSLLKEVGVDVGTLDKTSKFVGLKKAKLDEVLSHKDEFGWLGDYGVDLSSMEELKQKKDSVSLLTGVKVSDILSQPDKLNVLKDIGIDAKKVVDGAKLGLLKGANLDQVLSSPEGISILKDIGVDINSLDKTSSLASLKNSKLKDLMEKEDFKNILDQAGVDVKQLKELFDMKNLKNVKLGDALNNDGILEALQRTGGVDPEGFQRIAKLATLSKSEIQKVLNTPAELELVQSLGIDVKTFKEVSKLAISKNLKIEEVLRDQLSIEGLEDLGLNPSDIEHMTRVTSLKNFNIQDVLKDQDKANQLNALGLDVETMQKMSELSSVRMPHLMDGEFDSEALKSLGINLDDVKANFEMVKDFDASKILGMDPTKLKQQMEELKKNSGLPDLGNIRNMKDKPWTWMGLVADECLTAEDEEGECLSDEECQASETGASSGPCHRGFDYAPYPRVCCVHRAQCGGVATQEVTYFTSPDYPAPASAQTLQDGSCPLEVALKPGTCQVRLDFLDFRVGVLNNGQCVPGDSLLIRTNVNDSHIPLNILCGNLSPGQDEDPTHLYLHFGPPQPDQSKRLLQLHAGLGHQMGRWNIKVSQIQCDGAPLQAPPGCAQYYNKLTGSIPSFNLADRSYQTGLDLTTCIRPDPRACGLQYKVMPLSLDSGAGAGLRYGLMCSDYLAFAGEKTSLCGASGGLKMTLPVTRGGGQGFTFRSDQRHQAGDAGFRVEYRYVHNCRATKFFNYPTAK